MEYIAGNIENENNPYELDTWDKLSNSLDDIEGIMGYRIPSLGFREKDETPSFIIRTKNYGIILISVIEYKIISFDEENEHWEIQNGEFIYSRDLSLSLYELELKEKLKKNKELFDIRTGDWKVQPSINKYLFFYENSTSEIQDLNKKHVSKLINNIIGKDEVDNAIETIFGIPEVKITKEHLNIIDSILDGTEVFNRNKKKKVLETPQTLNDYIKKSLDVTFKLDNIQRQVALQVPPGPQRIRGLAGTGKTVILCMKAALAHKSHPDLKILFAFNTQSMYNQIKNTIIEYYSNETRRIPNWNNLHIFHAWGGDSKAGVYSNTANAIGIKPKNFYSVKSSENPLEAIYTDLLTRAKEKIIPEYDIVLIDEAQDFSPPFFETIYYLTKSVDGDNQKKRIIWAYDEFQSLTDLKIAEPKDLFGLDKDGNPNMPDSVLDGTYKGNIEKDFVLPNSYRNPRINLMTAHGIALGLYSKYGKVPMEDSRDWEARGYKIIQPKKQKFSEYDNVIVERPDEYSKNILETLLKENGRDEKILISLSSFPNLNQQLEQVVNEIDRLINIEKVEPNEILVINLDNNAKDDYEYIRQQLDIKHIKAVTPGFIEPTDSFKELDFVTLTTPFRAKGNEANIVFLINSQKIIKDLTFKARNAAFVAITRSRGWSYIYGFGKEMAELNDEKKQIEANYPYFNFIFPNEDQIKRKITIIRSNKDVGRANQEIDKLLSDNDFKALLIEKLSHNQDIVTALTNRKKVFNEF